MNGGFIVLLAKTSMIRCISADGKTLLSAYNKGVTIKYIAAPVPNVQNVNGGVKVSWTQVNGAENYFVFRKTGSGRWTKIAATTATSWTDKTTVSGTTYVYTVRCVTKDGKEFTSAFDTTGRQIKYTK